MSSGPETTTQSKEKSKQSTDQSTRTHEQQQVLGNVDTTFNGQTNETQSSQMQGGSTLQGMQQGMQQGTVQGQTQGLTTQNGLTTDSQYGTTGQTGLNSQLGATQSQLQAYQPTQALLSDIIAQAGGLSTGANAAEQGAIAGQTNLANQNAALFNPQIQQLAQDQLNGAGLGTGNADIQSAYDLAKQNLTGIANGENLSLEQNPYLQNLLSSAQQRIKNSVGSQFANAGRSFSGAHAQALGAGEMSEIAPLLLNQYNLERSNQTNALNQLMGGAVNQNSALDQSAAARLAARQGAANTLQQTYDPFTKILDAQGYGENLGTQRLGAVSNLLMPIATGFGQQTGLQSQLGENNQTGYQTMLGQGTSQNVGTSLENSLQNSLMNSLMLNQQNENNWQNQQQQAQQNVLNQQNVASDINTTGSSSSKTKGKTTGTTTGTTTSQTSQDPLQVGLGAALGVGGMLLSPAAAGSGFATVGGSLLG